MKKVLIYLMVFVAGVVSMNAATAGRPIAHHSADFIVCQEVAHFESSTSPFLTDMCKSVQDIAAKVQFQNKGNEKNEGGHRKAKSSDVVGFSAKTTCFQRISAAPASLPGHDRTFVSLHRIIV